MNFNKILVVEDTMLIQEMYKFIFNRFILNGLQLIRAMNGHEALKQLHKHPDVDLILLDINMPIMNGLEFLKIIKQNELYKKIPVVIVSTRGSEKDAQLGLEAGANAYVTKPMNPSKLIKTINEVTKNK